MSALTAERLRSLLEYWPEIGVFIRRTTRGPCLAGTVAGSLNVHGYVQISIDNQIYRSCRLAWLYVHGKWPTGVIDHINGDRSDDRISNIRDVTPAMNSQNLQRAHSDKKTSKLIGITKNGSGWLAQIHSTGKYQYLGTYKTQEEAHAAYLAAKRQLHEGCTI